MWSSSWPMERMRFPDRNTMLVAHELTGLLEQQERLLELPMDAADMTLYEMRCEQIGELMQQLVAANEARPSL
jgi:hypothetical protein